MSGSQPIPEAVLTSDEAAIEYVHRVAAERFLPIRAQLHAQHLAAMADRRSNADPAMLEVTYRATVEAEWMAVFDEIVVDVQTMRNPVLVKRIFAQGTARAEARYAEPDEAPAPTSTPGVRH